MTQIVDLGVQYFGPTHPGGQCLLSRATATLMLGGNILGIDPTANRNFDIDNAWVTLKRKLTVDLHIKAYLDSSITASNFVNEALETVQSLLIPHGHHLKISKTSHEYDISADITTLYAAFTICEAPDQLPQSLPARLPGKVRGCAVDPHPPPGINRATLSHITIHMKIPRDYNPHNLTLTGLWLKDLSDVPLLNSSGEEEMSLMKDTCMLSLHPVHSPLSSQRARDDDSNAIIEDTKSLNNRNKFFHPLPDSYSEDRGRESFEQIGDLNKLMSCAIRCLISKPSRPPKNGIDSTSFDEGPRLSKIAPLLFRPGYYENIRHRAGLVPTVTKSMAMMFRVPLTSKCAQKVASVESNLNSRYTTCTDAANTGRRPDFRSLTKCALWTALQKGGYRVKQSKNIFIRGSSAISYSDDCYLTEESDFDSMPDEDILYSPSVSVTGDEEIFSDEDCENEQDSGYSSFISAEEKFHWICHDDDSLEDEFESNGSEFGDSESDVMQLDTEDEDMIGSLALQSSSNITMTNKTLSLRDETTSQHYVCENEPDDDIIDDDLSSISNLAFSTNQSTLI